MVNSDRMYDFSITEKGMYLLEKRKRMSAHDLMIEQNFIAEVNAQGYYIQFLYQIVFIDKEEKWLIPVIIKYAKLIEDKHMYINLIMALSKPGFTAATEFLLEEFKKPNVYLYERPTPGFHHTRRYEASAALLKIKDRRYKEEYLRLAEDPDTQPDCAFLLELLAKLKYEKAYPTLLSLIDHENPWVADHAIRGLGYFVNHPESIPYIEEQMKKRPGLEEKGTYAYWAVNRLKAAEEKRQKKLIQFPKRESKG